MKTTQPPAQTVTIKELAGTDLLRGVPTTVLEEVRARCRTLELSEGDQLLSPLKENNDLYIVLSGRLTVHFEGPHTSPIRALTPGMVVGELSIIRNSLPTAWVVASRHSRVLALSRTLIWWLVDEVREVPRNLLAVMVRWILSNTQKIVSDRNRITEMKSDLTYDILTGLYNRRWLENEIDNHLQAAQHITSPLSIMVIGVDRFKDYNDTNGHLAGDEALIALADVFAKQLRPLDHAVRYGGEEFLVLLSDTSLDEAAMIAERLRASVERQTVTLPNGTHLPNITISVGLAVYRPGEPFDEFVQRADKKLDQAKEKGCNCCQQ